MSESDTSIPQKVAALVDALQAIRRHIGGFSPLDLAFDSWLEATDPDSMPWDHDEEDARKDVLAAATEFVEAVDTAERVLNTVPVSVLEPLSAFTGGVRWDMQTRRTLKTIQDEISDLSHSQNPEFFFFLLNMMGKAGFMELKSNLGKYQGELAERIFDLSCLPSQTAATAASNSATTKKPKKSTVRGEAEAKLIGFLTKHHQYAEGGCLNWEPIGSNVLADKADVGNSSANRFFNKWFGSTKNATDGYKNYRMACNGQNKLIAILMSINGEMPRPGEVLFGSKVPNEAGNPDQKGGTHRKPRGSELRHHDDD